VVGARVKGNARQMSDKLMVFEKKIKCNNVGAGFPRPIAWITDRGGENPPLRQVMWLRLIFKGHQFVAV